MNEGLTALYFKAFGCYPDAIEPIAPHASQRKMVRLRSSNRSVCGVVHEDVRENETFLYLAKHFRSVGLAVPEVVAVADDTRMYLIEDLGDTTLYDIVSKNRAQGEADLSPLRVWYERALDVLPRFQIEASTSLDFSRCYPHIAFDESSMIFDMMYFRDSFLEGCGIEYKNADLERDFGALAKYLREVPSEYFMYRDFQSRNIMVRDNKLWFIDFQGGRRGPLQYDVVSLLYQSSAQLTDVFRGELLSWYVRGALPTAYVSREEFLDAIPRFILIRMLQVLGTYGKVGLEQGKAYFQQSIPLAVQNLRGVLDTERAWGRFPELHRIIKMLVEKYDS